MALRRPPSYHRKHSSQTSLNPILESDDEAQLQSKRNSSYMGTYRNDIPSRPSSICVVGRIRREMSTSSLMSLDDLYEIDTFHDDRSTTYKRRSLMLVDSIMGGSIDSDCKTLVPRDCAEIISLVPTQNSKHPSTLHYSSSEHSEMTGATAPSIKTAMAKFGALLRRSTIRRYLPRIDKFRHKCQRRSLIGLSNNGFMAHGA